MRTHTNHFRGHLLQVLRCRGQASNWEDNDPLSFGKHRQQFAPLQLVALGAGTPDWTSLFSTNRCFRVVDALCCGPCRMGRCPRLLDCCSTLLLRLGEKPRLTYGLSILNLHHLPYHQLTLWWLTTLRRYRGRFDRSHLGRGPGPLG